MDLRRGTAGTGGRAAFPELGFEPRRITPGALRPVPGGSSSCFPALVLLLVGAPAGGPPPEMLLLRLRADIDLCDVPLVVAVDTGSRGLVVLGARRG